MAFVVLDGAMGSQLTARGVDTTTPLWSARALVDAPELVAGIHREYADAGATVHRTNTFRTRRRWLGATWARLAAQAVALASEAVPMGHRVAGSVGPLEDCYRPDLAPDDDVARAEHEELAWLLADEGADLLFCETFPSPREALVATRACVATGLPTWTSLTAGPNGDLLSPTALADAAAACANAGAEIVLVNCIAAERTLPYVEELSARKLSFGVYANAAVWGGARIDAAAYGHHAAAWAERGARVIGSCCGTGPAYVRALASVR